MSEDIDNLPSPALDPEVFIAEETPSSGPAPHPLMQTGRLDSPLVWLAHTTGFQIGPPEDEVLLADHARRWTSRAIIIATLMLAVFNSISIQTWATTLPPDWGSQTVYELATVWSNRLSQLGLDRPRAVVHDDYESVKATEWRGVLQAMRVRPRAAAPAKPPAAPPK